jgi:sugar lactone lactonase YvrE
LALSLALIGISSSACRSRHPPAVDNPPDSSADESVPGDAAAAGSARDDAGRRSEPPPSLDAEISPADLRAPSDVTASDATTRDAGPAVDASLPDGGLPGAGACEVAAGLAQRTKTIAQVPAADHDFTFDRTGNLIGVQSRTNNLWSAPYGGSPTMLASAVVQRFARGIRFLPNGDLVIADEAAGAVVKIPPQGGPSTLAKGITTAWGIAVDRDERIYVTDRAATGGNYVRRVDGASGDTKVLATVPNGPLLGITFSPDYRTLYFTRQVGAVVKMSISPDGKAGPIEALAEIPPAGLGGARLDAITTDECGNLYVVQNAGIIWRITPAGDKAKILELPQLGLITGVRFGSGRGGWKETALYFMRENPRGFGVMEVDIGVRGMKDPYQESQ